MRLSKRALNINSSPTLALNEKAKRLSESGKPIINLGVGEPSNLTPMVAVEAARNRLETRKIKYTPAGGIKPLKEAIAEYTQIHYGQKPLHRNILISHGAKHAIFNVLASLIDPGDEVILLAPYWVSYPEMVRLVNGNPVVVSPRSRTFEINLQDVLEELTKCTKAIIINSPNNPSGIVYEDRFISEIVKLCEEKEIFLIMDDIYHQLVFDDNRWIPGYSFTKKHLNSSTIVVINGISKTFGMTGFRIGWAIGPDALIDVMENIQSQTTSGVSILNQDAALGALSGSADEINQLLRIINQNRSMVLEELSKIPQINTNKPGGTFYCLPDFSSFEKDSIKMAEYILEKANVAVVPGISFGAEGHLRISYAGDYDEIKEAITRIQALLGR